MRYLITGHTGFKGSWLCAMLKLQGHEVHGIALPPDELSHFNQASIESMLSSNTYLDINRAEELKRRIHEINPEIIIHLAAQPLVRQSYADPIGTYQTNVIGTLNALEATRELPQLKATLVITTDKVYKNLSKIKGYVESDPLGGDDPYSSSKAAADIATQSWRASFASPPIAIARAGNVIGGGDWAADRLIPDIFRARAVRESLSVRNPNAIRPWQHVLDCLSGYCALIKSSLNESTQGEWNFGPNIEEVHSVSDVLSYLEKTHFNSESIWHLDAGLNPAETQRLVLDSSKARNKLNWFNRLSFSESLDWTAEWYIRHEVANSAQLTLDQIGNYLST